MCARVGWIHHTPSLAVMSIDMVKHSKDRILLFQCYPVETDKMTCYRV